MAHFAYTRGGGIWATLSDLLHTEMADIDAKTTAAVNGDGGGTWAPTSVITIGGLGLTVTSILTAQAFAVTADATFGHNVTFNSGGTFTDLSTATVFAGGNVSVGGSTAWQFNSVPTFVNGFTATGAATINSTLVVTGNATLESDLIVEGALTVDGNAHLAANLQVDGSTGFTGSATFGAAGFANNGLGRFLDRIQLSKGSPKRLQVVAISGNADITVADWFLCQPGGADMDITIVDGQDTDVLEFAVDQGDPGTHVVNVKGPGITGTLTTMRNTTNSIRSCRVVRAAGVYRVFDVAERAS